jgi:hypothetical protein
MLSSASEPWQGMSRASTIETPMPEVVKARQGTKEVRWLRTLAWAFGLMSLILLLGGLTGIGYIPAAIVGTVAWGCVYLVVSIFWRR